MEALFAILMWPYNVPFSFSVLYKSNLGIFNATKHKKVPINYFKGAENCCKEPQPPMPTKIMEKPWKC